MVIKLFFFVSLSLVLVFVALFQKYRHYPLLVYVESFRYLLEKYVPVLQFLVVFPSWVSLITSCSFSFLLKST